MTESFKGHYYLAGRASMTDHNWAMMPSVVENSGPQLIHYHKHGEPCNGHKHEAYDEDGRHDVKIVSRTS